MPMRPERQLQRQCPRRCQAAEGNKQPQHSTTTKRRTRRQQAATSARRTRPARVRPKRRFCGGGASSYQFIATRCCHPLIYTPFGGLQARGAGLVRLAEGFIHMDLDEKLLFKPLQECPMDSHLALG